MAINTFPIAEQTIQTANGSQGNGTPASPIQNSDNGTTNAHLTDMANGTVKARLSAGSGDPEDVTLAALKTALAVGEFKGKQATLAALNTAVPSPVLNEVAYLDDNTGATGATGGVGSWVYWDGSAWVAFDEAATSAAVDGNHEIIVRADSVTGVAPTTGEIASPANGDSAMVVLTDGTREFWEYTTSWSLTTSVVLSAGKAFDTLTESTTTPALTMEVVRNGGTATTLVRDSSGEYTITAQAGADIERISFFFQAAHTETTLGTLTIKFDNSANGRDRRFALQLKNGATGTVWDMYNGGGVVPNEQVTGNVTTILIPNANGNGSNGFYLEMR